VLAEIKGDLSMLTEGVGGQTTGLAALRTQLRASGGVDLGDVLDDADLAGALEDAAELLATLLGAERTEDAN
jgi:hypothetical protein